MTASAVMDGVVWNLACKQVGIGTETYSSVEISWDIFHICKLINTIVSKASSCFQRFIHYLLFKARSMQSILLATVFWQKTCRPMKVSQDISHKNIFMEIMFNCTWPEICTVMVWTLFFCSFSTGHFTYALHDCFASTEAIVWPAPVKQPWSRCIKFTSTTIICTANKIRWHKSKSSLNRIMWISCRIHL